MKNYLLLFLLTSLYYNSEAQLKMIAKSTYAYNGVNFYLQDTSIYFNNPSNTNPVHQDFVEAYNYAIYDSSHYYYFNQATQQLDFITRSLVTFNAGFAHQTLATSYNYTNNINDTKDDYSNFYTGNNLDSQYFEHTILSPLSSIFYSKNYLHYNIGNNNDTAWFVSFQNGNFFKTTKYVYTFNAQNVIDETFVSESTDSVTYVNKIKSKNYYNLANNIDSIVTFFWQNGNWYKYKKDIYLYNGNNLITSKEVLSFNLATQVYIPSGRVQYARSNGTLLDSTYHQSYDQIALHYDTLNKYGFVHFNGLLIRSHSYTFNTGTDLWEPTQGVSVINYYYNYLPNASSNASEVKNNIILYPNPCETYLHIKGDLVGAQFAIYSVDGKFVQSGIIGANRQIFVQTLPEGHYFFRSEMKGKRTQESFLKQ